MPKQNLQNKTPIVFKATQCVLICSEETENQYLLLTHEYIKSQVTQTGRLRQEDYSKFTGQPGLHREYQDAQGDC